MNALVVPFAGGESPEPGMEGASGGAAAPAASRRAGAFDLPASIGAHAMPENAAAAERSETSADMATSEAPAPAGRAARSGASEAPAPAGRAATSGASQAPAPTGRAANLKRLEARLRGLVGKAIADYRMIEDGDRVMACVSGGKDSYAMAHMLATLARSAPVSFEVVAVNLDQKQPGFPADVLPAYFASRGIAFEAVEQDTYSIVKRVLPETKTMCGLCSRLRRGVLYRHAAERGFTKIALGHHRDDIVETLFMNMFHGGRLRAMPPKLRSDDGRHVVIRPLAYCAERDIDRFARAMRFPIIPCNLCGSQDGLERQRIKAMLAGWERESPGRTAQIFRALRHVGPSHLADRELFDFESL